MVTVFPIQNIDKKSGWIYLKNTMLTLEMNTFTSADFFNIFYFEYTAHFLFISDKISFVFLIFCFSLSIYLLITLLISVFPKRSN